ncbi:MAG: methyltransferase family protein [bacterium]
MAPRINRALRKLLYTILFVIVLPLLLIRWAVNTDTSIPLPVLNEPALGISLSVCGILLMLSSIISLYVYGNGFPMRPYPSTNYVTKGIYKFIRHPIYTGAGILAIGISIFTNSTSGLWLISPVLILGCVAFVMGFENEQLRKRFPNIHFKPLIDIPEFSEERATLENKISAYLLVLLPWFICYLARTSS